MSEIFTNDVLCPLCEFDILEYVRRYFYRDPAKREFEIDCPRCKALVNIEVLPVPVFQASIPVGRIRKEEEEKVYCIVCDAWVLKSGLKRWTGDDALHRLCPGCDSDLLPVERLEE